jgi:transposase-like protein
MARLHCHWRSRESYLIRITTLEFHRKSTPANLTEPRRDKAAAKRFFKRVLRSSPVPRKIVTDQYAATRPPKLRFG